MWLLKTEPGSYGWDDLEREKRTRWDGVSNPAALKNLRAMKAGDEVVLYHTGGERAVVGLARVTRAAYPDPELANPKRVVVDVEAVERFRNTVGLDELKALKTFEGSPLVRQGRLSVVPLQVAQWKAIVSRGRK